MKKKRKISFTASLLFLLVSLQACQPNPKDIQREVREYLAQNPQLIASQVERVLASRKPDPAAAEPQASVKQPVKVEIGNAPTLGAKDAPITIVAFSDFQCPYCKQAAPTLKLLLKEYPEKVRIAFRQHPLSIHSHAMSAAKASLAANEQGKFWRMHDGLFDAQKNLSDEIIRELAKKFGLNMEQFEKSWKSDKFDKQIQDDIAFAISHQAVGTPAFFVNGILVAGAEPITVFKQMIDRILAEANP